MSSPEEPNKNNDAAPEQVNQSPARWTVGAQGSSDATGPSQVTIDVPMEDATMQLAGAMHTVSLGDSSRSKEEAYRDIKMELNRLSSQMEEWNLQQAQLHIQLNRLPGTLDEQSADQKRTQIKAQIEKVKEAFEAADKEYKMYEGFMGKRKLQTISTSADGDIPRNYATSERDVCPVVSDEKHQALARIFKYKTIPVVSPQSMEIDWSRVQLEERKGAPILQLRLNGVPEADIPLKTVRTIVDFLHDFEVFYKDNLTILFGDLAWRYMLGALKASGLTFQYEKAIMSIDEKDRSWDKVEECIHDIFKLSIMQAEILDELFATRLRSNEDAHTYVDRIEVMFRAANVPEMARGVITKIVAELPDEGREKVLYHFKKVRDIPSLEKLLEFIRSNPSVVKGTRTNPFAWVKTKFSDRRIVTDGLSQQSHSRSSQGTANARPSTSHQNNQRSNKKGKGKGQHRHAPYPQRTQNQGPATTGAQGQRDTCKDPICISFKRTHSDASCYRHTDRAKFEELNRKEAAKNANKSQGFNKSQGYNKPYHQRHHKVSAMRNQEAVAIQEDSLNDSLGNQMDYNNEDVETYDYIDCSNDMVAIGDGNTSKEGSCSTLIVNASAATKQSSYYRATVPNYTSPNLALVTRISAIKQTSKALNSDSIRETGFRGPEQGDNRIAIPIVIKGETYTAFLDSGATHSVIDRNVAKDLGIKCSVLADQKIELGESGIMVTKVITNDCIPLVCNERTVEWQVKVLSLGYYDFLIGMDLFARFGFEIAGIRLKPQPRDETYVIEEKPSIVPEDHTDQEQLESFLKSKETFMQRIEAALQQNGKIDPKSHCPLDIMRVELKVKEGCVIQERSRKFYAQTESTEVDATVKKWLDNGIIIPAPKGNPYNNSLTLAARRDLEGVVLKYRVCLDPRKLNKQLAETDNFPLPIINDILERVSGHKYFTTLDLSQAYHRLPLDEKSRPYTAFVYNNVQYMFARAPFGLKPMTSIFQRGMAHLLGDLPFVAVYVDDIVIFSDTVEKHKEHVRLVIERLTKAKLIINKEKSHFLRTQVVLLGFLVDANGKRINPEKVANVSSWAPPTNGKMVQRYLGMFNYFREYIPLYSTISAPLDRLRNVRGNFTLDKLELKCFEQLKRLVAEAPVLSFPDFSLPFYVATDASNLGIGAVLYQLPNGDESKVNYISFMARALKPHEKNYPAYKKELLGIIYACKKFHYYIWGRKFTLYTDHRPLTYIHDQTELPQILADWKETLFSYDFDCIYRPGMLNIIPDALSRAFPDELWVPETKDTTHPKIAKLQVATTPTRTGLRVPGATSNDVVASSEQMATQLTTLATPEEIDNQAGILAKATRKTQQDEAKAINPHAAYTHAIQDPALLRQVLTEEEQRTLLKETHSFGHPGVNAMIQKLHVQGVTWPKLKDACANWIRQCSSCQHFNIVRKGYHPLKAIHATLPGEHVAIDLAQFPVSNRGYEYVLLVVDICTRFVFLEPLKTKNAETITSLLFKLFCTIGFPKIVQSDQGSEFKNDPVKDLLTKLKTEHRLTTPYHPRANGVAERHVRTMKETLRKEMEGRVADWDLHIPLVQLQMNTRIASLHSSTPFSLFLGRSFAGISDFSSAESHLASEQELRKRLEYLTNLVYPAISEKSKATQKKMIEKFNASHFLTDFPEGTFVMAKDYTSSGTLEPYYKGPYQVAQRTGHGAYILKDSTGQIEDKRYAPEQLKKISQSLDKDEEEVYELNKILRHVEPGHKDYPKDQLDSEGNGPRLYEVSWKGYEETSFIPYEEFVTKAIVTRYNKSRNLDNPHVIAKRTKRDLEAEAKAARQAQAAKAKAEKQAQTSRSKAAMQAPTSTKRAPTTLQPPTSNKRSLSSIDQASTTETRVDKRARTIPAASTVPTRTSPRQKSAPSNSIEGQKRR